MKTFATVAATMVAAIGIIAFALPVLGEGKKAEQRIRFSDCPAAVQKAINENAEQGEILEVEMKTLKDGTVVYEAEIKKPGGKKMDVKVDGEGKLLKLEQDEDNDKGAADHEEDEDTD